MIIRTAIPLCRRPRHRGFTLVEMLVAVGIVIIMLLAFGQIVSQSHDLVNGCQQIMRMNSTASVISQLLQRDLLSICKDGPLTVDTNRLTFARVASHTSALNPAFSANAAMIDYGRAENTSGGILYRQALLLMSLPRPAAPPPDDAKPWDLGPTLAIPDKPSLPVDETSAITSGTTYWYYLARGCTKFTCGIWNGTDYTGTGSFTSADLTNWPSAVRVVFELQDGKEKQKYELIIDLP